jgi:hypothetical protein
VSSASTGLNVRRTGAVDDDCPLTVTLTNDLSEDARTPDHPRDVEVSRTEKGSRSSQPPSSQSPPWPLRGAATRLQYGMASSQQLHAGIARTNAAQKHTEANQHRLADLSVFENFIDASFTGDSELAGFSERGSVPSSCPRTRRG